MLMNTPTAVQLLRNSLDRFLAKDMKGWTELCDEDVVAEFPFAPEGSAAKIGGRAALYEYLRSYPTFIDVLTIPTLNTYATDDPNVAIAEWHASGRVIGNGNPYEMSYATFVTFRHGLIANYREYWNPTVFTAAMAGTRFDTSVKYIVSRESRGPPDTTTRRPAGASAGSTASDERDERTTQRSVFM